MDSFFTNLDSKMTQDKYYAMMQQLGKEPVEAEIPPDFNDFPSDVQNAINIYGSLGDRVVADVGFLGKTYDILPELLDTYYIENKELLMEVILWLDARNIKASSDSMKKSRDKLKSKSKSKK